MAAVPGLTVGHGDLIGLELLAELKRRGLVVVRLEAHPGAPLWEVAALAQEVVTAGLQPCFVLTTPEQVAVLPAGSLIDGGNEPDIKRFGWSVSSYVRFVDACLPVLVEHGHRMYVPVISNLNKRGFDFAKCLPWDRWPADVICGGFHRYAEPPLRTLAHPPSRTREEEIDRFRAIVGQTRALACTEVGYHTSIGAWTEDQAAENLAWERDFFTRMGVELVCAYGINDGPDRHDPEQNYGMRRIDGSWKPLLNAFTGVAV